MNDKQGIKRLRDNSNFILALLSREHGKLQNVKQGYNLELFKRVN
jgi:hypothetical protein